MDGVNNKYNIEIEVLTPLSIGAGAEKDWVRGVDFVVDNNILYKLNLKKMVAVGIDPEELTNYFATKNENGIKAKLSGKLNQVSDFSAPFPAETDNDIKSFIKNQLSGNPLIVGSSLKGALRSILFDYLGGKTKDGKDVFGTAKQGDEFMRFIKISDSEFIGTKLINTKIFNLQNRRSWNGGWKHGSQETNSRYNSVGFNTIYECLIPGQKGLATLMMSETQFSKIFKHIEEAKKKKVLKEDIKFLFSIINNHTKEFLKKEKKFFQQYDADKTDLILKGIDDLLKQIPEDNSYCIMRMSAGSGFHSITGDWQFKDDFTDGKFDRKRADRRELSIAGKILPKSRKIAITNNKFYLPGFIKLSNINDNEIANFEINRQAALQKIEQQRKAKIEADLQKQAAAKKAEEELKAKVLHYNELVAKANQLYTDGKFENAKEICNQAETLCPNKTTHLLIKDLIDNKLKEIEFARTQQENQEREQRERIARNSVPLAEKIANATKLNTLYGNVETWLKYNASFSDNDLTAFKDKIKEIAATLRGQDLRNFGEFKSWKKVVAFVGDDIAKQWYDELKK